MGLKSLLAIVFITTIIYGFSLMGLYLSPSVEIIILITLAISFALILIRKILQIYDEWKIIRIEQQDSSLYQDLSKQNLRLMEEVENRIRLEYQLKQSEKKNNLLVSNIQDIIIMHENAKIISVNEVFERILGYSSQEVVGKSLWDFIFPEDQELAQGKILTENRDSGNIVSHIVRFYTKTKEIKFFYSRAVDARVDESVYSYVFLTDMTDLKRAQEEVTRQVAIKKKIETEIKKLTQAIEQSQSTIVITDSDGHILYANPSFEKISGYSVNEAMGQKPSILKSNYHDNQFYEDLWMQIKTKKMDWHGIFKNKKKDGSYYWEDAVISPVLNDQKEVENFIAVKQDITEKKESEDKLKEYSALLEIDLFQKKESLKRAQLIQKNIISNKLPVHQTLNMRAFYMPSEELSGDFFHIQEHNGRLILIMGDCEGHGIEASLDSVLAKSICDRYVWYLENLEPGMFIYSVNQDIIKYFAYERYMTLFAGVFDPDSGLFYYASANAEIPYLIRKNEILLLEQPIGMHLGVFENQHYEKKTIQFFENDIIIFYTDALREIILQNGKFLGHDGLREIFLDCADVNQESFERLIDKIRQFSIKFPLEDDTTLIMIKNQKEWQRRYEISQEVEIRPIEEEIIENLKKYDFQETEKIIVGLEEMCINAIVHGNNNDFTKKVIIEITLNCKEVVIDIKDEGKGFDPDIPQDSLDPEKLLKMIEANEIEKFTHGRGICLARSYMDDVIYNESGNQVRIVKRRDPRETLHYAT